MGPTRPGPPTGPAHWLHPRRRLPECVSSSPLALGRCRRALAQHTSWRYSASSQQSSPPPQHSSSHLGACPPLVRCNHCGCALGFDDCVLTGCLFPVFASARIWCSLVPVGSCYQQRDRVEVGIAAAILDEEFLQKCNLKRGWFMRWFGLGKAYAQCKCMPPSACSPLNTHTHTQTHTSARAHSQPHTRFRWNYLH